MQFLYPAFLFALAALAIPIIIHLFYFRRFKKVYFTNVRFLKEVKEETSSRRRLKNLLVLLMRLLALAFLVLAFAQPFIPQKSEMVQGKKAVSIFVDNSFSMSALSQDVPLLDKAKQRAREIVGAYALEDEFQVLTNDFEGRHQRTLSQEDALGYIDEIKSSPAVKNLSTVLARQKQALQSSPALTHIAYLISDFQKNISDIDNYADSTLELNLLPLQAVQERNVSIDSAWFEAPVPLVQENNALLVRVRNHSDQDAENIRLSMRYEGQSKPVGVLSIPGKSYAVDTINFLIQRTGWHEAELQVTDFPIQFDDIYYVAFKVDELIKVLTIDETGPNRYLNSAFSGPKVFQLTNQSARNLEYSQFPNYQLIVLNELKSISTGLSGELQKYVTNGGNLLVFPAKDVDLASYSAFLRSFPANEFTALETKERTVGDVNTEEFIFKEVFTNRSANLKLPSTQSNYGFAGSQSRMEERLLTYRDGSSFLSKYLKGNGHLYLCSSPLEESVNSLVQDAEIFIPMLYKMAVSAGKAKPIAYTIGRDDVIEAPHQANSADLVYKLKGTPGEFIPGQRIAGSKVFLGVNQQIPGPGFYKLSLRDDETVAQLAFNYDRKESDLEFYRIAELAEKIGDQANMVQIADSAPLTASIEEKSQGIVLWRWCLILVIGFLAVEALLLRLWRA